MTRWLLKRAVRNEQKTEQPPRGEGQLQLPLRRPLEGGRAPLQGALRSGRRPRPLDGGPERGLRVARYRAQLPKRLHCAAAKNADHRRMP